jgi:hypothetical protein
LWTNTKQLACEPLFNSQAEVFRYWIVTKISCSNSHQLSS